jgi:YesN/AraC family two-component response regulator
MIYASAGDILLVNPRQIHSVAPDSSQVPYQDMCINFDLTYFSINSENRCCRTISYLPNSPLSDYIRGQVHQIITAYQEEKSGWEWEVKGHLYLMFSQLITNHAAWLERAEATQEDTFMADISSYVNEHLHEVLRVDRIAAQFSYSTAYFCRLFKKTFACTFTEYVNRQRIVTAKRMLDNGMYSISEAANAVGINNYSYFSKLFREQVGLLPSDYQKHLQKIKKL